MSIITFPSVMSIPKQITWTWQPKVAKFGGDNNPAGGGLHRVIRPGGVYTMSATWDTLEPDEWLEMEAFLEQLGGAWVKLPHWAYSPRGSLDGTPTVNGGGQDGKTLNTTGWAANAVGVLKTGDFLGLEGNALVRAAATVDADGSGNAAVPLTRPLPVSPSDASAIEVDEPKALFTLAGPESVAADYTPPEFGAFSLTFRQDITDGAGS